MTSPIDFSKLDGPIYSGRERGENARKKVDMDQYDNQNSKVDVILPTDFITVTSSFFLGMFDKSIIKCGTRENFFDKFIFKNVPNELYTQFMEWANRVFIK